MFGNKAVVRGCMAGVAMLWWTVSSAEAQLRLFHRPCPEPCIEDLTKPPIVDPKKKDAEPVLQPVTTAALGDSFTSVPYMMGDYFGYSAQKVVSVPVTVTVTTTLFNPGLPPSISPTTSTSTTTVQSFQNVIVRDPIVSRAGSGLKVADNESPRPTDRFFFTYNYFHNLNGGGGSAPGSTSTFVIPPPVGQIPTTATIVTTVPSALVPGRAVNVHREMFGFEKTFLGGAGSIGLRLPFFQTDGGDGSFGADDFGDMTFIAKIALFDDVATGSVLSTGLAVTVPTGPAINTIAGDINSTLLQPFIGYIVTAGNFYFQGIHSIVYPTTNNDAKLFFNDFGAGYVIPTGGLFAYVAPNLEAHIATPLNFRDGNDPVFVNDTVTLTGGVHLGLGAGR
ncbi:MAG: hypothetical protein L0215_05875, partial [Gemmataceae bacterium]|nr:hypothetical protein [Gemmataceae bacterium]